MSAEQTQPMQTNPATPLDDDETAAAPTHTATAPEHFDTVARGMARWARERPDIDASGKAVVGRVLRLQGVILKAVNATLAAHGLKYPAYAILATLRVEGAPYRLSPSQLQQTMLFSSGGISNLLLRLEKDGLVRRTSDRSDRRGVIVELTDKGVALADVAMTDHANTERHLIRMFSQDERAQMADMLARMLVVNADAPGYV